MIEEGQLLPVVFQAFPALCLIARFPYPFKHLLEMVLNVVLDAVDLDDVLPEVVVLYVCDLRVFVLLFSEVEEVVGFHFLDDLDQPIVEGRGELYLMLVFLFQPCEAVDVGVVIGDAAIAQSQYLQDLLINGLVLILRVVRKLVLLTHLQVGCSLQTHDLTSPRGELSRTASTVKLLILALGDHELRPFGWMVQATALGLPRGLDAARLRQSLAEVIARPISVLYPFRTDQRLGFVWSLLVACLRISIGVLVLLPASVGIRVVLLLQFLRRAGWFGWQLLAGAPLVVLLHAESVYHRLNVTCLTAIISINSIFDREGKLEKRRNGGECDDCGLRDRLQVVDGL